MACSAGNIVGWIALECNRRIHIPGVRIELGTWSGSFDPPSVELVILLVQVARGVGNGDYHSTTAISRSLGESGRANDGKWPAVAPAKITTEGRDKTNIAATHASEGAACDGQF